MDILQDIEIGKRIKKIIDTKNIKNVDFANKLNITQAYVSKLINKGGIPSDRLVKDICEKFAVNEEWLRTGEGGDENMFLKPQKNELISRAATLLGEKDPVFEAFVETYSSLTPANRKVLLDFSLKLLNALNDATNK